jgi:hypothetical protein
LVCRQVGCIAQASKGSRAAIWRCEAGDDGIGSSGGGCSPETVERSSGDFLIHRSGGGSIGNATAGCGSGDDIIGHQPRSSSRGSLGRGARGFVGSGRSGGGLRPTTNSHDRWESGQSLARRVELGPTEVTLGDALMMAKDLRKQASPVRLYRSGWLSRIVNSFGSPRSVDGA